MKKKNIIAVAGACGILFSGSVFAYGGMSSTASAMGSGRLTTGYSFSLDIKVPYDTTMKPVVVLPTAVAIPRIEFDATQIPVHELPPLPLTLDDAENNS